MFVCADIDVNKPHKDFMHGFDGKPFFKGGHAASTGSHWNKLLSMEVSEFVGADEPQEIGEMARLFWPGMHGDGGAAANPFGTFTDSSSGTAFQRYDNVLPAGNWCALGILLSTQPGSNREHFLTLTLRNVDGRMVVLLHDGNANGAKLVALDEAI